MSPSNSIKLSSTVWELQDICFRGDNYIMKKVRVVSLAHDMPTGPPLHPYQILSNYLTAAQAFSLRGDKYMKKKVRVVFLACDMSAGPYLVHYQISSKLEVTKCTRIWVRHAFR